MWSHGRPCKLKETLFLAAYCHFGRTPYTNDGTLFFEWENLKDTFFNVRRLTPIRSQRHLTSATT